jgi:hypothetical protein
MLAVQLVAAHSVAMECFRRAVLPDQAGERVDMYLRHGERLMGLFGSLCAVLDKQRSKAPNSMRELLAEFKSGLRPQE